MAKQDGFVLDLRGLDDTRIPGFSCKCEECGSSNVAVYYRFTDYGGYTGYDIDLSIDCRDCDNLAILYI